MKNSVFMIAVVLCVGFLGYLVTSGGGNGRVDPDLGDFTGDPAAPADEDLVLIKFGATWCGPCRMVDQELQKLADTKLPVVIRRVDVDEHRDLAMKYNVSSIPRMILMHQGQKVGDLVGYQTAEQLEQWVNQAAAKYGKPGAVEENPFTS